MNLKNWQLYALYALVQVRQGLSTPVFSDIDNFMFYDPAEECNNSAKLCLTSFKYCTRDDDATSFPDMRCHKGAKEDDLSWYSGNKDDIVYWIQDRASPLAVYGDGMYTLKWQNNNPEYPTTVMWRSKRYDLSMYRVVDAGDTEWTFSIDDLAVDMLPTQYFPANGTQSDRELMQQIAQMAQKGSEFLFSIAQPESPEYRPNNETRGFSWFRNNATDESSPFLLPRGMSLERVFDQRYARRHEKSLEEKWRIGVGVGVGLGMPLISAIVAAFAYKAGVKRGSPQGRIVSSDK